MKQKGITIASSCGLVLLLSLVLSLFLSFLYYFNVLSSDSLTLSTNIVGWIAFFVGGCYLGLNIEKKVLIHSLIIAFVGVLISLIFIDMSFQSIMYLFLNWVFYNFGVMISMIIKKS